MKDYQPKKIGGMDMKTYIKVKLGTEAYELLYKIWNYKEKWNEHNTEIEEFLGFKSDKSLYYSIHNLIINRDYLPEEWEPQFKKNTSPAEAKTKSKLRLEWIELCKKLGLEVYETREFAFKYGLYFNSVTYHNLDNNYFIEIEKEVDTTQYDWAEKLEEATYLRIRADYLDKQVSA